MHILLINTISVLMESRTWCHMRDINNSHCRKYHIIYCALSRHRLGGMYMYLYFVSLKRL